MKNTLPEIEGNYYMIDSSGNKKQVKIEDMAISINQPKNLHVVESEFEHYACLLRTVVISILGKK